jgi:hypothetical protein
MRRMGALLFVGLMGLMGCQGGEAPEAMDRAGETARPMVLGPADGFDLAAQDTGRVGLGDMAPDFSLETYRGDTLTLSEFQGEREIILVFYRGSW